MKKLTTHQLAVLACGISELIGKYGYATLVQLGAYFKSHPQPGFRTNDWCGYKKLAKMLEAYPDFFEIYSIDATNQCVRLVQGGDFSDGQVNMDFDCFVQNYFSDEFVAEICKEYNVKDGQEIPCVFRNNLRFTYHKAVAEGKVLECDDLRLFHTGFFHNDTDDVFLLWGFDKNQPVRLFIRRSVPEGRQVMRLFKNSLPELVHFPRLEFDPHLHIEPEYGHIIQERYYRLPSEIITLLRQYPGMPQDYANKTDSELVRICDNFLRRLLDGCIQDARTRLYNRRVEAVLFWFKRTNKMCWLVPLRMGISDEPNLALVLEPSDSNGKPFYHAQTILPLKEAFKCARLLGPVRAEWLCNAWE